jgi:hypothetical protein
MNIALYFDAWAAHSRRRTAAWLALGALASGCVLDSDDLCSENQVIWGDDQRCVCAEGTAYTPDGCVACSANESSSAAGCVCVMGYARPAPGEACQEIPAGIGDVCSGDAECGNPYPHCQIANGVGYCTSQDCSGAGDCGAGYSCNTGATPTYCRRPPVGAGKACTSPADCAGTEATFCDTFVTQSCLVQDCNLAADDCFAGTECCDLSSFGLPSPLCVLGGMCQQ